MAARLIDDDPALAHEHALAASRRAGRVGVVRELRTYRRISGSDDQIALIVDSERGMGRPDRALEEGRSVDRAALPAPVRVDLAIALSGARLDLGETERALIELDIPELDPNHAHEWSPALFAARAGVLEELGRTDEAAEWQRRAVIAAEALDDAAGYEEGMDEVVYVEELEEDDADDTDADVNDIDADEADSDSDEDDTDSDADDDEDEVVDDFDDSEPADDAGADGVDEAEFPPTEDELESAQEPEERTEENAD
jgi:hypothetical protein